MRLDFFGNDRYKVLYYLHSISETEKGELYFQTNQQEIANEVGFSKQKVNVIMQEFQAAELIELLAKNKGTYHLTKKAVKVLHIFEKDI